MAGCAGTAAIVPGNVPTPLLELEYVLSVQPQAIQTMANEATEYRESRSDVINKHSNRIGG